MYVANGLLKGNAPGKINVPGLLLTLMKICLSHGQRNVHRLLNVEKLHHEIPVLGGVKVEEKAKLALPLPPEVRAKEEKHRLQRKLVPHQMEKKKNPLAMNIKRVLAQKVKIASIGTLQFADTGRKDRVTLRIAHTFTEKNLQRKQMPTPQSQRQNSKNLRPRQRQRGRLRHDMLWHTYLL